MDDSMVLSTYPFNTNFHCLKSKRVDISGNGFSVKTSGRLDREHLIDATQRAFIKTIGASSFGTVDNVGLDDSMTESLDTLIRVTQECRHACTGRIAA